MTTSFVRYTPSASHHGHTLMCRGANEALFTSATQIVEDHQTLQIYCEYQTSQRQPIFDKSKWRAIYQFA